MWKHKRRRFEGGSKEHRDRPARAGALRECGGHDARRVGLIERSGIIDFFALAMEGTSFLSANDQAVTLNLNAAALLLHPEGRPPGSKEQETELLKYERRGVLNNLGGSVTFGAKLPGKEITGGISCSWSNA